MSGTHQQGDDGRWVPAEPLPWQPGLDWEVRRLSPDGWLAEGFIGPRRVARITARWRPLLGLGMRLAALVLRVTGHAPGRRP